MAFEAATAVQQLDSHTYTADFKDDWCIGSVPHGGYVTSTLLKAVKKHFSTTLKKQDQPHTLALHLDFLRRTQTGPVTFWIRDVKLGRQTSIVHVTLEQEGREEVVGYATQSNLAKETGLTFSTHWQPNPPRIPLTGTLEQMERGEDPAWTELKSWPNPQFRKATTQIRSWFPRHRQPAQNLYDEWMCLKDPSERWTNEKLGFIVDLFPQLLESYLFDGHDQYDPKLPEEQVRDGHQGKAPYWYPTLLLNLDVKKALPEEGVKFLCSRVQTKSVRNGRYDLEVMVWDEDGDLVALSHHVCFAVDSGRNLAKRSTSTAKEKL